MSETSKIVTTGNMEKFKDLLEQEYIKGLSISGKTITYMKGDGTTGTITTQDTDTHYTTGLRVGASSSATANAAASNGSVYLNVLDNTTVRDSHLIKGAGATIVTSDANGVITITSTDTNTNTTYSAGNGISLSGTTFSNSGVRSIASGSANGTISVNTNGTTADVAVKGLGSAAYTNSSAYATSGHTHNYAGSSSAGGAATNVNITTTNPSSASTYYIPFLSGSSGSQATKSNNGIQYYTLEGTTSAVGKSELGLGNSTASGTAGNKKGRIYLYGTSSGYTYIDTANTSTSNYTATLPAKSGTIAMTSDIPSSLKNPNVLTISLNGTSQGAYDGSNAKSINITASSIGAAASSHTHNYAGSSSAGGAATKALQDGNGNVITSTYAPKYEYSTTDLTAGTSSLTTGKLYIVYE